MLLVRIPFTYASEPLMRKACNRHPLTSLSAFINRCKPSTSNAGGHNWLSLFITVGCGDCAAQGVKKAFNGRVLMDNFSASIPPGVVLLPFFLCFAPYVHTQF